MNQECTIVSTTTILSHKKKVQPSIGEGYYVTIFHVHENISRFFLLFRASQKSVYPWSSALSNSCRITRKNREKYTYLGRKVNSLVCLYYNCTLQILIPGLLLHNMLCTQLVFSTYPLQYFTNEPAFLFRFSLHASCLWHSHRRSLFLALTSRQDAGRGVASVLSHTIQLLLCLGSWEHHPPTIGAPIGKIRNKK